MTYPPAPGDPNQPYQQGGPYPPPPYQPQANPQQGYPQQGYPQPYGGYAPPVYYGQPGGPHFLPPEAGRHSARFDPIRPVRVLASPARRLSARLLDILMMWVLAFVIALIVAGIVRLVAPAATGLDTSTPGGVIAIILLVLLVIAWLLYEPLFVSKMGGTPGKLWLGIRVVRSADARRPGFGTALGRFFFPFLMAIVPLGGLLNVLWLLWDRPLYQCLHDKVVSTVVVYVEGESQQ
jgi:uncharacterized RDD family membrane protein YckC